MKIEKTIKYILIFFILFSRIVFAQVKKDISLPRIPIYIENKSLDNDFWEKNKEQIFWCSKCGQDYQVKIFANCPDGDDSWCLADKCDDCDTTCCLIKEPIKKVNQITKKEN